MQQASREAMIDCEHFFDGYKANRAYALAVATHRLQGRRALGRAVRHQRRHAAARDRRDRRRRDASTCRARISASTPTTTPRMRSPTRWPPCAPGARQIQGALNGLGERCGNANLTSLIPTLLLKSEFADRFETQVTPERLTKLTHASRLLDEILNRAPNRQAPYVGEAAFATKAGIHASRHPEGAGHLRARAARERRQPPPRAGVRPGRQVEPGPRAGAARHPARQGRPARRARCSTR